MTGSCENETSANDDNNSDSVTTSVSGSAIDLIMGDITDVFDPSGVSDSLTYTVTVTNGGSQDALAADGNEVVIRANMPTVGVTFNSGLASQGFVCVATNSDALLTCTGDLDAGESTTLTIEFVVTAGSAAEADRGDRGRSRRRHRRDQRGQQRSLRGHDSRPAACNTCIDLVMGQIFADPNPAIDGDQVTYAFTVTNVGDLSTLTDPGSNDVQIRIDLDRPSRTRRSCHPPPRPTSPAASHSWGIPSTDVLCVNTTTGLDPAEGTLITITVDVDTASTPSFVDFDVSVDPANLIAESPAPFEANNTGGLRIDVVAP